MRPLPLTLALGSFGAALFGARCIDQYCDGKRPTRCKINKADKEQREHLSEKQVDHMVEDSFPASDPPSTY